MKRKLLLIIVALLSLFAHAYDAKIDGIFYYFTENEAEVTYGDNAYSNAVVIPASVTYGGETYIVTCIGTNAFANCSNLTSIKLPSTLKRIKTGAFKNCTSLSKIIVTDIASWCGIVYDGNSGGDLPMYYAKHLYSDDNTEITEVVVPEGVKRIESLTFRDAKSITSLSIPNSVTYIGREAFRGMHSITSIVFPQDITSIEPYTCQDCEALTSVDIPEGVTNIGDNAFAKCYDLKDFYCYAENAPTTGSNVFKSSTIASATLHVPKGSVNLYNSASPWSGFASIKEIEYDAYIDGIYYNFSGDEAKVTYQKYERWSYISDYEGAVIIPESVTYNSRTYNVTSIGDHAFSGCSGLSAITIPSSVTSIGNGAFYGCSGLTSITIPESVTSIGSSAFSGCKGLTSITIPNGVTSIGIATFYGCSGLTSITIPESVTSIGESAFKECSSLTSITIPNSVTSIGEYIFYGCSDLTTITIGSGVTSIGYHAFEDCSNLTSITIGNGVTSIGNDAFYNCSGLNSITIPNSVTSIGNGAFSGCSGLTSVTIGNSVMSISNYAFYNCSGLSSITIPNSVTSIGNGAFSGCSGLTSVTIPNSVTSIGNDAFEGCSGLSSITIPNSVTSIGDRAFYCCSGLTSIIISENVTSIGNGAFSGCSGLTSITIGKSVTSIGNYVFSSCSNLTSVTLESEAIVSTSRTRETSMKSIFGDQVTTYTIGENVQFIGEQAFEGCSGLTSVTVGNSVTSISNGAFSCCSGLTSITIPNSVTSIGDHAFYCCSNLTSVIISENVTSIGNSAFGYCSGLTSVTIPESVTSIGNNAFYGCSNLTSIIISENVTSIGDDAFYYCRSLTSITIGSGVTSIGYRAFYGCSGLICVTFHCKTIDSWFSDNTSIKEVIIGDKVTSIGDWAFSGCSSLTSITIPRSVTSIGIRAFSGCSSLTSITIPSSVTSISSAAFYDSGLTSVTLESNALVSAMRTSSTSMKSIFGEQVKEYVIGNSVKSIGSSAFYGCSGLTSITIPASITNIENSAFGGCTNLISVTLNCNSIVSASRTTFTSMKSIFGNQVKTYIIGNEATKIGNYAFCNCDGLTSITLPNSVTSIGDYAFFGCSSINTIIIPECVSIVGESTFRDCINLVSVSIPDNITSIGKNAFAGCANVHLYVGRGTDGLLSIWNYGMEPYDKGNQQVLMHPSISVTSTTQTTIRYEINNLYPELKYNCVYDEIIEDNEYLISGLRPECQQPIDLIVHSSNNTYSNTTNVTTLPISPTIISDNITASSIYAKGSYIEGDANVISKSMIVNEEVIEGVEVKLFSLDPDKSYNFKYEIVVEDDNGNRYPYDGSLIIKTASLTLTTQQPKVINVGNVVVSATSNLDIEETNVGFEWRRTDWTDDFASNTSGAYLYGGKMEGYIRNLNADKLWKYRPYYESDSGKRYYGEWVGIDPTNTSYFEPTVYTYSTYSVSNNTAEVKGYAMRGSDNVAKQGFMYWKKDSNAKNIPANAKMVEAKGNLMFASLENLDYDTEYSYVAFVTTSENETFYGKEQTFKTGVASQEVIDRIDDFTPDFSHVERRAIYDLNGCKLPALQKGINIIRYRDGTTQKMIVR